MSERSRYVLLESSGFTIGELAATDQEAIEAASSELQNAIEGRYLLVEFTGRSGMRLVAALHARGRIIDVDSPPVVG